MIDFKDWRADETLIEFMGRLAVLWVVDWLNLQLESDQRMTMTKLNSDDWALYT